MKEVRLNATDGKKILVRVGDAERCIVCNAVIGDDEWLSVIYIGDANYCVVAHADHFKEPGSSAYEAALEKFARAVARNLENRK